jgi:hypothetical protein
LFLVVPNRIPANISIDRKNIEALIPKAGNTTPEIIINPSAEPARSALYVDPGEVIVFPGMVSSRKMLPVRQDGTSVDNKIIIRAGVAALKTII